MAVSRISCTRSEEDSQAIWTILAGCLSQKEAGKKRHSQCM